MPESIQELIKIILDEANGDAERIHHMMKLKGANGKIPEDRLEALLDVRISAIRAMAISMVPTTREALGLLGPLAVGRSDSTVRDLAMMRIKEIHEELGR